MPTLNTEESSRVVSTMAAMIVLFRERLADSVRRVSFFTMLLFSCFIKIHLLRDNPAVLDMDTPVRKPGNLLIVGNHHNCLIEFFAGGF